MNFRKQTGMRLLNKMLLNGQVFSLVGQSHIRNQPIIYRYVNTASLDAETRRFLTRDKKFVVIYSFPMLK